MKEPEQQKGAIEMLTHCVCRLVVSRDIQALETSYATPSVLLCGPSGIGGSAAAGRHEKLSVLRFLAWCGIHYASFRCQIPANSQFNILLKGVNRPPADFVENPRNVQTLKTHRVPAST